MLDSGDRVNVKTSFYAVQLGLAIRKEIDVSAQWIDSLARVTYEIVIADSLLQDQLERV